MRQTIDGVINVNKPQGKTSFQVVSLVRKLSGTKKAGHSGTLDPDATGVLLILLGRATKLAGFLMDSPKTYQVKIAFGCATTTYDFNGTVTHEVDTSSLTLDHIKENLKRFQGDIEQTPPMHSAVKYRGKPLYRLARAGVDIPRKPRKVHVFRVEVLDWQNPLLTLEIECSKGTYIRSIAHDLGNATGYSAHQRELARTRNGPFHIDDAVSIPTLEEAFRSGQWRDIVKPLDAAVSHLPPMVINPSLEKAITYGHPFPSSDQGTHYTDNQYCRVYSQDKRFLGVVRFNARQGLWEPERVLALSVNNTPS